MCPWGEEGRQRGSWACAERKLEHFREADLGLGVEGCIGALQDVLCAHVYTLRWLDGCELFIRLDKEGYKTFSILDKNPAS